MSKYLTFSKWIRIKEAFVWTLTKTDFPDFLSFFVVSNILFPLLCFDLARQNKTSTKIEGLRHYPECINTDPHQSRQVNFPNVVLPNESFSFLQLEFPLPKGVSGIVHYRGDSGLLYLGNRLVGIGVARIGVIGIKT